MVSFDEASYTKISTSTLWVDIAKKYNEELKYNGNS